MVLYSHNGLPPDNVDAEEISLYGNFIYYDFRSWGIRLADPHPMQLEGRVHVSLLLPLCYGWLPDRLVYAGTDNDGYYYEL